MQLKIKTKVPDGEHFFITVNKEKKIINRKNKVVFFNIPTNGTYHITIEQKKEASNRTLKYWVIYILTIIPQGLFYILASIILFLDFLDDNEKWYEHTKMYYLKSEFDLHIYSDMCINLRIISGKFNKLTETYTKPNIQIHSENSTITLENSFKKSTSNIKNEFFNCIRMIISITSTVMLLAITFMFIMANNLVIFGICIFLSLLCLFLAIFLPLLQYRKFKEITYAINDQNNTQK